MRPFWRKLHRWLGLSVGLWLTWLGLTGSLLGLAQFWEETTHPGLYRSSAEPGRAASLQSCLQSVRAHFPEHAVRRFDPAAPGKSHRFYLEGDRLALVDPGSARVLGWRQPGQTLKGRVLPLHELGEPILPWVALSAFCLLLSGWRLQPPQWALMLRRPRARAYDLHRWLGWWLTPWLSVLLLTGSALVWYAPIDGWLRRQAGQERFRAPQANTATVGNLDRLLASAQTAFPDAIICRVHWPVRAGDSLQVRLRRPGEGNPFGRSYVYLEPDSGRVLAVEDALRDPWSVRLLQHSFAWHAGYFPGGGMVWLVGLGPVTLVGSGLLLWRRRRRAASASASFQSRRLN